MPVERYFLGWDAPVTAKVRGFLLPSQLSGPVDLEKDLIVVPTRQAGRLLREALALYCTEQKTALVSSWVVTPTFFLGGGPPDMANPTEVMAVWADVLMRADPGKYEGIFPAGTPEHDFTWAVHTGKQIQNLRDTLVNGRYQIADVLQDFGSVLEELDRWHDLAELETAYLQRLSELDRQDPCSLKIKQSERPELPEGIERVVVAMVPDPTPLMLRALERLADKTSIAVLIHAPKSLADHFDGWGRPVAEKWRESQIDIPDAEKSIILAGSPASQSRKVLEAIAVESGHFGPNDIAIGVPDGGVTPFLAADLADKGLLPFDPAGKAMSGHPLYKLLEAFRDLVNEGTYSAFSTFLRHADVLDFLREKHRLSARRVLEELDKFQNYHLPMGLEDIFSRFPLRQPGKEKGRRDFENLGKAVAVVREQVQIFEDGDLDGAVRSLLETLYKVRTLNPDNPEDEGFVKVAEPVDDTLRELSNKSMNALGIEKRQTMELLLLRLGEQRYFLEREGATIDLEGWLELSWNDAPFLIVTGMNDGVVPSVQLSDVFLPDSLRRLLNLRHDADRLAADAYLMRALIESRREKGRVCFIVGKTSKDGDPLKPSRLLFHCSDEELPRRAERLFGSPDERRANYPPTTSFLLQADLPAGREDLGRMSVTQFRDYLVCPFRFYLRHVLGMEELGDEKREMDALDFGSLMHYVLQKMAGSAEMRCCENEVKLHDFLYAEAEKWVAKRFGPSPPLMVGVQLDSAKQRLAAAACVQAGLVGEGWEILRSEMEISRKLADMLVRGRIDRIDRHRETGLIRLLDYKTSDRIQSPEQAHFASLAEHAAEYMKVAVNGAERRWIDLQMPLYRFLLPDGEEFRGEIELGYFNLPKSVNDTGVIIWDGFCDELLQSAVTCAEGVVRDIRNRRFWPPATKVTYDDFETLFRPDVSDCIDVAAFTSFMKRGMQ